MLKISKIIYKKSKSQRSFHISKIIFLLHSSDRIFHIKHKEKEENNSLIAKVMP